MLRKTQFRTVVLAPPGLMQSGMPVFSVFLLKRESKVTSWKEMSEVSSRDSKNGMYFSGPVKRMVGFAEPGARAVEAFCVAGAGRARAGSSYAPKTMLL